MEELKGHNIGSLPISGLKKISDLLEYEGPILSHFIDSKNNNYFYYWVDYNENYNRWLVWKVEDEQFYKYLKGNLSLKDVLLEKNKSYVFSVDIDKNLNADFISALEIDDLPELYIPEESTYYSYEIPKVYNYIKDKFEASLYLTLLKEKALYFKIEPIVPKFQSSVSILDAGDFFKKLGSSFIGFIEEDFFSTFKDKTDFESMKKIISRLKEILTPRIVEAEYGSLKVAISTDHTHPIENGKYKDWQKTVLERFKREVVDIDYTVDEQLEKIANKYTESARKKIFAPYIDLLNDSDFKVEVTNFKKTFKRKYGKLSKKQEQIILPKKELLSYETDKKKLYSVIIELDEGVEISKLSRKNLQSGLLFSQEVEEVDITIDSISSDEINIILKKPIRFAFRKENSLYHAENKELDIIVDARSKEILLQKLEQQFINLFVQNSDNEAMKELFDNYIDDVIIKNGL